MIKKIIKRVFRPAYQILHVENAVSIAKNESLQILAAQNIIQSHKNSKSNTIQDCEFKVFSQWGDDGIIQYLIREIALPFKTFLALCDLAEEKGYYFVGCNSAGNNAYFVRKDKIRNLKPLTAI